MTHAAVTPAFAQLMDAWAPVSQLDSGFTFTEGPIWHPTEHYVLFSDMPADVRRRWDQRSGTREVMRPSNKCNGMTRDHDHNLIVCEHATSSVVREYADGTRETLATHYNGIELNSPNDVIVKSDGAIYFSDPWYGRMEVYGVPRPRMLGFQGVYRIPPGGGPTELLVERERFEQPNGLCFSPDERRLYVNDTVKCEIHVFKVWDDGSVSTGEVFARGITSPDEPGVPDGMKCDRLGNIWVSAPGGVWVYAPSGVLVGKVRIPELVANLHWGGPDYTTLFITATHSLYSVRTYVGGRLEPFMTAEPRSRTARGGARAASAPPRATASPPPPPAAPSPPSQRPTVATPALRMSRHTGLKPMRIDPARAALIIMDLQNDVVAEGGAFAATGSAQHCREQNAIANAVKLAEAARARGVMVIHVWNIVEPQAAGAPLNAPLFEGIADANALVRGTWGAAPVPGLEARSGDFIVEKARMSAWEGTRLETLLRSSNRDTIIVSGAWTNMSVEHTSRTGADKGYFMVLAEDACSTMNAQWHRGALDYALTQIAAIVRTDEVIRAWG